MDSSALSRKGGSKIDRSYVEALEAFWQRKHQLAITILTDQLTQESETDSFALFYRLWIEVCAQSGDRASLRALKPHLFAMGQEKSSDHVTFFALRGLVHFELDEIEAATVLAQSCENTEKNPYVLELLQRLSLRMRPAGGFRGDEELNCLRLLRQKDGLKDYFHWQYVVLGLVTVGHTEGVGLALEHMGQFFPRSPLPHLFEYHRSLERGYFAAAATVAERLRELAPEVVDYMYFQAYAYFEDGDYPSARKVLHEANQITGGFDAEIVGLLGHCHAKLGGAKEASICLQKSMQLLSNQGLPASHVAMEYLDVQQEIDGGPSKSDTKEMPREPQGWIVHLSPRRVNELLSSPENVTERLLRPMGTRALPGDLCFLTSVSPETSQWNILAVYAVESDPLWHPIQGHQSILKRVILFPQAISIDVSTMPGETEEFLLAQEQDQVLRHSWQEIQKLAHRFGIRTPKVAHAFRGHEVSGRGYYQLDADALMIVEDVISKQRDAMVERRKSLQSRRPTA
jgi:tetratricopeptide (TPR) repeat protein